MSKYSFLDDYSEGCHPRILDALTRSNLEQQTAYGNDDCSENAKTFIRSLLGNTHSEIFFVAGGTLANLIIISSALRSHEAVIAADSGHIVQRETGAIEATGHKIISIPTTDGKLRLEDISRALTENSMAPHMAKPRMVYISNATETGRIYTKSDLTALSRFCRDNDLLFFVDGARLGAALTGQQSDVTLADLAALTDIFWIGGTKAGGLIGEAIVINRPELAKDFAYHIKQRGALLAKGRLLGIQFQELFRDGLFFDLSKQANGLAQKISSAITRQGYALDAPTETNQIFPVLPRRLVNSLHENFSFYEWAERGDDLVVLRLVTSWATDGEQVEKLIQKIQA